MVYVNYLGYDEMAHAYGPGSTRAMQTLRGIDRSIAKLWRVTRRGPSIATTRTSVRPRPDRVYPLSRVTHGKRLSGGSSMLFIFFAS
jgi:hypothetical protein